MNVTDRMVIAAWAGADGSDHAPGNHEWMRDALSAALAAAWVPCGTRMPEPGARVLVAVRTRFGGDLVTVARFEGGMWEGDDFDELQDDPDFWMPLPAAPKER